MDFYAIRSGILLTAHHTMHESVRLVQSGVSVKSIQDPTYPPHGRNPTPPFRRNGSQNDKIWCPPLPETFPLMRRNRETTTCYSLGSQRGAGFWLILSADVTWAAASDPRLERHAAATGIGSPTMMTTEAG